MNSVILNTATRIILPILLLFSIFILLRGHHEPGGGFVGGLVASMAFALNTLSSGVSKARKMFPASPTLFLVIGIAISLLSGLYGLLIGLPAFTGVWSSIELPVIGLLNTPLIFDIGVYLVVFGVSTSIIFTLKLKE